MEQFIAGWKTSVISLSIGIIGGAVAFYFLCVKVEKVKNFIFKK
jgi:uncharacterized membrane-anchored protein YhcB (DUF1043 family)